MSVTNNGTPTLAGLMTFSKYPQTYFPQLCITAVSLPGTQMGESGSDDERFIDNKRITGAIPDMLEEALEGRNNIIRWKIPKYRYEAGCCSACHKRKAENDNSRQTEKRKSKICKAIKEAVSKRIDKPKNPKQNA